MENFPFLSFDATTIIGVLLNTLILFLIIKHFLFNKVNAVLEERKNSVAKTYEDADSSLEKAKALEYEYTERISSAKDESAEILKNAAKKAQSRSDEIITDAKLEAHGIVEKANSDIEKEKKRAINQIKDEISDIALSIAEKVVVKTGQ